jgi:hypothetical protein
MIMRTTLLSLLTNLRRGRKKTSSAHKMGYEQFAGPENVR